MAGSSGLEVAHIFRLYGEEYRQKHRLSRLQLRAMRAIEDCRTAALGGHVDACEECGVGEERLQLLPQPPLPEVPEPGQGALAGAAARRAVAGAVLPRRLHAARRSSTSWPWATPKWFYDLLFASASETLLEIAADPKHLGARIGVLAVLHTWSQTLGAASAPALHRAGRRAVAGRRALGGQPRRDSSCRCRCWRRVFRGKFLAGLKAALAGRAAEPAGGRKLRDPFDFHDLLDRLYQQVLGGLQQASLRRPRAGARVPGPLHPPGGPLQPPARPARRRPGHLHLQGLQPGWPASGDDAAGRGIHPPLPAARPARSLRAHSLLRPVCQPPSAAATGAVPGAARCRCLLLAIRSPTSARTGSRSISGSRARIRLSVPSAGTATCAGSGNCPLWRGGRRHDPPGSLRLPCLVLLSKVWGRCVLSANLRYNRANETAAEGL